MSDNLYIHGIKPPGDKWRKMKVVYEACEIACVGLPSEVVDFFEDRPPDPLGVAVNLENHAAVSQWRKEFSGFVVDLTKLPKDITMLRFSATD